MAQSLSAGRSEMSDQRKSQMIHLVFSCITVLCTMGAVLGGYWQIQAGNERMLAEFRVEMGSLTRRVSVIEGSVDGDRKDRNAAAEADRKDRIDLERRLTGMEVSQNTMLGVLREMRDDARQLRERRP